MARRPAKTTVSTDQKVSMSTDDLLMAVLDRGGDTSKTGRFLMTFKEGAAVAGMKALQAKKGLRTASAEDFASQAVDLQQSGDADAVMFPEIGVALVSGEAAAEHGLTTAAFAEDMRTHTRSIPNTSCSRRRSIRLII
jgi:subtilisin